MPSGKKSCFQHITKGLCTLTVLAAIGVAAWHFLGRPETPEEALDRIKDTAEDIEDALGNLTDSDWIKGFNDDPFVGDNSTYEWPNNGQGLSLELWNALDETWQTEFQVAVDDWQESPALQLSTRQVDVDPKCSVVDGIMKVCNDNYGATGWLGVFGNGQPQVVASVAKMNEYYLLNADYPKRQYTMCHEIGHGFGLPHTDENHNNRDLGNCLDYTNTPENNMRPGQVNFDRLAEVYLNRRRRRNLKRNLKQRGVLRRYLLTDGTIQIEHEVRM